MTRAVPIPQERRTDGRGIRPALRRAFTLLEVLLTIVLIAALASVFWGNLEPFSRMEDLSESTRRVKALFAMCRAQAMTESREYRIRILPDGSIDASVQLDPLLAPNQYAWLEQSWAKDAVLLETVWVETVLVLPDGPPPILVEDENLDLEKFETLEPVKTSELERAVELFFSPDGSSTSVRFSLRDVSGRGIELTLDGRVGRVTGRELERLEAGQAKRPEKLDEDPYRAELVDPATLEEIRR